MLMARNAHQQLYITGYAEIETDDVEEKNVQQPKSLHIYLNFEVVFFQLLAIKYLFASGQLIMF